MLLAHAKSLTNACDLVTAVTKEVDIFTTSSVELENYIAISFAFVYHSIVDSIPHLLQYPHNNIISMVMTESSDIGMCFFSSELDFLYD